MAATVAGGSSTENKMAAAVAGGSCTSAPENKKTAVVAGGISNIDEKKNDNKTNKNEDPVQMPKGDGRPTFERLSSIEKNALKIIRKKNISNRMLRRLGRSRRWRQHCQRRRRQQRYYDRHFLKIVGGRGELTFGEDGRVTFKIGGGNGRITFVM